MKFSQPVPALPVRSVTDAQIYYRDKLGFEVAWHNEAGRIGAVAHGDCAIFFREVEGEITPSVHWVFAEDIDRMFAHLSALGADIVEPPEDKPWGLRQFTIRDLHGHMYHLYRDL